MDWVSSFEELSFNCLIECAVCCKRTEGVSLTVNDYQRIAKHITSLAFADKLNHSFFAYRLKVKKGVCIFLSEGGTCKIYPFRPLLCRLYPLQLHIKWDGRTLWCLEHCLGVNDPDGKPVDDRYIESLTNEILDLEGEAFFDKLREYVLRVKKPFTPLLRNPFGVVYSNWPTKERMWSIVLEVFHNEALQTLTPRGRLGCIRYDILPPFQNMVAKGTSWMQSPMLPYIEERYLQEAYTQFKTMFPDLAKQSAEAESLHLETLEEKGTLVYCSINGETSTRSRRNNITVHKCNGERAEVEVGKLMHMLPRTPEALMEEEKYLKELIKREGRFGKEIADLPVDLELQFQFMVADVLELKANAFTIHSRRNEVGMEEMRDAICAVERTLAGILNNCLDTGPPSNCQ